MMGGCGLSLGDGWVTRSGVGDGWVWAGCG